MYDFFSDRIIFVDRYLYEKYKKEEEKNSICYFFLIFVSKK